MSTMTTEERLYFEAGRDGTRDAVGLTGDLLAAWQAGRAEAGRPRYLVDRVAFSEEWALYDTTTGKSIAVPDRDTGLAMAQAAKGPVALPAELYPEIEVQDGRHGTVEVLCYAPDSSAHLRMALFEDLSPWGGPSADDQGRAYLNAIGHGSKWQEAGS